MRKLKWLLVIVAVLVVAAGVWIVYKIQVPKPQIASAEGQPTPDFTLKDQDGNPFHLADLRGNRVVLIFYRGYW